MCYDNDMCPYKCPYIGVIREEEASCVMKMRLQLRKCCPYTVCVERRRLHVLW
jgi:hypothetical protein